MSVNRYSRVERLIMQFGAGRVWQQDWVDQLSKKLSITAASVQRVNPASYFKPSTR